MAVASLKNGCLGEKGFSSSKSFSNFQKTTPCKKVFLMIKIVRLLTTITTVAVGSIDTDARSEVESHIELPSLPELYILPDSEPQNAIPEVALASFDEPSDESVSAEGSSSSSSQAIEPNDVGFNSFTGPLLIKGNRFFDTVTGKYFAIRGVNYYPRPNTGPLDKNNLDLFSSEFKHIWKRDLQHLAALEANVIRLYAVDPDVDHTEFMCALQTKGIYVIVDLGANCEGCEITPDAAPACYPASYKMRGEKIIKQFARYDNVMAFSGGNEINHRTGGNPWTWNAPCQKKFIRDMRAFIQACPSLRKIPVGLVVADTNRDENAQYYNCRTDEGDELENAQWYGINTYVHCDDISDPSKATGFNMLRDSFKSYDYSIPVVLTEFGCVSISFPTINGYEAQRTFHDAVFMNMPEYSDYFAGGVAFEYSTENANSMSTSSYPFKTYGPQNYGLGYFSPKDCTDAGTNCTYERFPNFDYLQKAYKSYDGSGQPTLGTYTIPHSHSETSACPENSPILNDFKWEGDSAPNESCPVEEDAHYQCPLTPSLQDGSYRFLDDGSLGLQDESSRFQDGYIQLNEINASSNGLDSSLNSSIVTESGAISRYDSILVKLLISVLAVVALSE
ncbi:putative glucanosyltransferase, glycoside hydrolase superfamily [Plasmopara halstedii]